MERNTESNKHLSKVVKKKVTWSKILTDVKILSPQPSVFDPFVGIVFLEEEEEEIDMYESSK